MTSTIVAARTPWEPDSVQVIEIDEYFTSHSACFSKLLEKKELARAG